MGKLRMPFNKGTLDAYRTIVCRNLQVATGSTSSGSAFISGSLTVYGAISGASYQSVSVTAGVQSVAASGSADIEGRLYFTGSGDNLVTQSGKVITVSGSGTTGVSGLSASGSTSLTGLIYITGSGANSVTQVGQVITVSGSTNADLVDGREPGANPGNLAFLDANSRVRDSDKFEGYSLTEVRDHAPNVHASTHASGSGDAVSLYKSQISDIDNYTLTAPGLQITGSSAAPASFISGSLTVSGSLIITGSISGSSYQGITVSAHQSTHQVGGTDPLAGAINLTSLTSVNITGSTIVSGADFRGPTATITNINCTNLTGSTISGSDFRGPTATITSIVSTNATVTNLTGSSLVSGSMFRGPSAVITNITATNVTGSSLLSSSMFRGPDAVITSITATNITGSVISGSYIYAKTFTGSTISGSTYQGGTVTVRKNAGSNVGSRQRLNFVEGAGVTFTISDDSTDNEVDVQVAASGTPAKLVPSYTIYSGAGLGGPYFAQDDAGNLDYSGSNATTVIQNAIDAIRTVGGLIFIKNGHYSLGGFRVSGSATAGAITIEGESNSGTILNLTGSSYGAYGYSTGSETAGGRRAVIYINSAGSTSITIKNLRIEGNCTNQVNNVTGITATSGGIITIRDCIIMSGSKFGIHALGSAFILNNTVYRTNTTGSAPQYPNEPVEDNCVGIRIEDTDCRVEDNMVGWTGRFYTPDEHKGYNIVAYTSTTCHRNWTWSGNVGIWVDGSDASVEDNFVEQIGPRAAIAVNGHTNIIDGNRCRMGSNSISVNADAGIEITGSSSYNLIQNNKIFCYSSPYIITTGIRELGTANNNTISCNHIGDTHAGAIIYGITWVGSNTIVFNNFGYKNNQLLNAEALVYSGSDSIYAVDRYGNIRRTGSDSSTVINWAINNLLTSGRQSKEKVVVVGTHTMTGAAAIPSFTIFELRGKLSLVSGSATGSAATDWHVDLLHQADKTNGNSYIEIIGGEYDGTRETGNNNLPQGSGYWNYDGLNCIYFGALNARCHDIQVKNVICRNAGTVNLHFDSCYNVLVENVRLLNPFYHGTHVGHNTGTPGTEPNEDFTWINVYSDGPHGRNPDPPTSGGSFEDGYDSGSVIYSNCTASGSYDKGFNVGVDEGNLILSNCHAINCVQSMDVLPTGANSAAIQAAGKYVTVTGCIVTGSRGKGINVSASRATISNNVVHHIRGVYGPGLSGINTSAPNSVIDGNSIFSDQVTGSASYSIWSTGNRTIISNNTITATGSGTCMLIAGNNVIVEGNIISGSREGLSTTSNSGLFDGNHIYITGSTSAGMNINGNSNIIQNNWINAPRPVALFSTYNGNIVKGNYLSGSNSVYITTQTGVVIVDNILYGAPSFGTAPEKVTRNLGTGYVTENYGYQTINAASGSFAHNLSSIPIYVNLTASGSIPLETSWMPSGSTGIWVYHNGTPPVGIYWKAEV